MSTVESRPTAQRPSPTGGWRALQWATFTGVACGILGAVVGLLVGLSAYPPTAVFAAVELGIPATAAGVLAGLIGAMVVSMGVWFVGRFGVKPQVHRRTVDVVRSGFVIAGSVGVVAVVHWLDWASVRDTPLAKSFGGAGWDDLLVVVALGTAVSAGLAGWYRRWWLHAVSAVVAMSTVLVSVRAVVAARTAAGDAVQAAATADLPTSSHPVSTGVDPAAVVGIGLTVFIFVVCFGGITSSWMENRRTPARLRVGSRVVERPISHP